MAPCWRSLEGNFRKNYFTCGMNGSLCTLELFINSILYTVHYSLSSNHLKRVFCIHCTGQEGRSCHFKSNRCNRRWKGNVKGLFVANDRGWLSPATESMYVVVPFNVVSWPRLVADLFSGTNCQSLVYSEVNNLSNQTRNDQQPCSPAPDLMAGRPASLSFLFF